MSLTRCVKILPFTLAGTLQISLGPGSAPALGNSFDLMDWNSVSGFFNAFTLPALSAGLVWNVSQLPTTGVLSVTADILGDYDVWKLRFGNTAGSGSFTSGAVPEPSTVSLLMLAAAGWCLLRCRAA